MNKLLRQRFKKVKVADPGRHRARLLAQQGRAAGGHPDLREDEDCGLPLQFVNYR